MTVEKCASACDADPKCDVFTTMPGTGCDPEPTFTDRHITCYAQSRDGDIHGYADWHATAEGRGDYQLRYKQWVLYHYETAGKPQGRRFNCPCNWPDTISRMRCWHHELCDPEPTFTERHARCYADRLRDTLNMDQGNDPSQLIEHYKKTGHNLHVLFNCYCDGPARAAPYTVHDPSALSFVRTCDTDGLGCMPKD